MAAQVRTKMPPAHLLADKRHRIEVRKRGVVTVADIRKQKREVILRDWQELYGTTQRW